MEGAYPAVKHCRLAAIPGARSRGNPRHNNLKWLIFTKNSGKAFAEAPERLKGVIFGRIAFVHRTRKLREPSGR
jgi:hypothetical protein